VALVSQTERKLPAWEDSEQTDATEAAGTCWHDLFSASHITKRFEEVVARMHAFCWKEADPFSQCVAVLPGAGAASHSVSFRKLARLQATDAGVSVAALRECSTSSRAR
jgi:hypothetical protein